MALASRMHGTRLTGPAYLHAVTQSHALRILHVQTTLSAGMSSTRARLLPVGPTFEINPLHELLMPLLRR